MASGVPVVQPARGSFTEMVERTGGGQLVPATPASLADGLLRLWRDPELRATLGRRGAEGVRAHYTIQKATDRLLEVYGAVLDERRPGRHEVKAVAGAAASGH
jgi:glycosyltransferase involved in cell wall biosynthesis